MNEFIDVKMTRLSNGNIIRAWPSKARKGIINFHCTNSKGEDTCIAFSREAIEVMGELSELFKNSWEVSGERV
jgi:hypothetical protein